MTTTCPRCGEPLKRRGNFVLCNFCGWSSDPIADWLIYVIGTIIGILLCWAVICAARAWGWL